METFLLAYCLTGDQMTVLACVSKSAKLSGCQHVCGAQKFDLTFNITHAVCQSQSILYSAESHQAALYYRRLPLSLRVQKKYSMQ